MALQNSGVISLNDVHKELNSASGVSCSLNDDDFRALTNILGSETVSLEDFYGLSSVVTVTGKPEIIFTSGSKLNSSYQGISIDHTGYYDLETAGTLVGTDILQDMGSVQGNIIYETSMLGLFTRGFQIASIRSLHATNFNVKYLILSIRSVEGRGPLKNEGWDNLEIWKLADDYQGANPTENPDLVLRREDANNVSNIYPTIDYAWQIQDIDIDEFFGKTTSKKFYAKIDDAGSFTWYSTSPMAAHSDSFTITSMNHVNPPSASYVQAITQITCNMTVDQVNLVVQDLAFGHDTSTTDSRRNDGGTYTPSQEQVYFTWNNAEDGQKVEMRWKVKDLFIVGGATLPSASVNNKLFGQIGQEQYTFWNTAYSSNTVGTEDEGKVSNWVDVTPELMGGSNDNSVITKFGLQMYSRISAVRKIISRLSTGGYIELQIRITSLDGTQQTKAFRKYGVSTFYGDEMKVSSSTGNQDY